jgi:hypothetical protein
MRGSAPRLLIADSKGISDLYDSLPQRREGRREKPMIIKQKKLCVLCVSAANNLIQFFPNSYQLFSHLRSSAVPFLEKLLGRSQ